MSKYIIGFSKTGTICYTSHLDLMRIWKRAFKRTGIALAYSQGFNPHPKMGFAQPLSLGYWGMEEYIEFETQVEYTADQLLQRLAPGLPEGIELKQCMGAGHLTKTLASHTVAAQYMIEVPLQGGSEPAAGGDAAEADALDSCDAARLCDAEDRCDAVKRCDSADRCDAAKRCDKADSCDTSKSGDTSEGSDTARAPDPGDAAVEPDPAADLSDPRSLWHSLMDLDEIQVWKRQKKKKEPKLIDIKPMIREITFTPVQDGGTLYIDVILDCGSDSNLSPELIISSALKRFGIPTDRSEIGVMRKRILFDQPLEKLLAAV